MDDDDGDGGKKCVIVVETDGARSRAQAGGCCSARVSLRFFCLHAGTQPPRRTHKARAPQIRAPSASGTISPTDAAAVKRKHVQGQERAPHVYLEHSKLLSPSCFYPVAHFLRRPSMHICSFVQYGAALCRFSQFAASVRINHLVSPLAARALLSTARTHGTARSLLPRSHDPHAVVRFAFTMGCCCCCHDHKTCAPMAEQEQHREAAMDVLSEERSGTLLMRVLRTRTSMQHSLAPERKARTYIRQAESESAYTTARTNEALTVVCQPR